MRRRGTERKGIRKLSERPSAFRSSQVPKIKQKNETERDRKRGRYSLKIESLLSNFREIWKIIVFFSIDNNNTNSTIILFCS
jgi:hypothetical protein